MKTTAKKRQVSVSSRLVYKACALCRHRHTFLHFLAILKTLIAHINVVFEREGELTPGKDVLFARYGNGKGKANKLQT